MGRTGSTNYVLRITIDELRKASSRNRAPIWRYVAEILSKSSRSRVAVNLSKISRYASEGEVIVVPGKVLGAGILNKRVTIAAAHFSKTAIEKIERAGSRHMHILDLIKENPKGSGVRVII
ncbi:MAG: 50S ribosomal protein L18e [Sulfolobales archaeon]